LLKEQKEYGFMFSVAHRIHVPILQGMGVILLQGSKGLTHLNFKWAIRKLCKWTVSQDFGRLFTVQYLIAKIFTPYRIMIVFKFELDFQQNFKILGLQQF
jgi:hypothetical protein